MIESADDWPLPKRDHASTRTVTNSPIDTTTVARLEVVWRSDIPGVSLLGNLATTPPNPGASNVVAIDVADGSILWDVEVEDDAPGSMTVVNDLVFTSTLSGQILALDRATGNVVWRYQAEGGINGWPAVAGELIIFPVGFSKPPHLLALRLPT